MGVSIQMQVGYGLLPCLFADGVSTAASILETVIGVSFIVAPMIGSFLFVISGGAHGHGYIVPFVVLGACQSLFAATLIVWFPRLPASESDKPSLLNFSPRVLLPVFICIFTGAAIEYCGPTLQPFLAEAPFHYSISMVGVVFAVCSIVYSGFGPLVGTLDDNSKGRFAVPFMLLGMILTGLGYILIAPATWLHGWWPLETGSFGLWLGIVILGIGGAFGLVPTYGNILNNATHADEMDQSNATSALYNVAYGIGAFLGPTLGGMFGGSFGIPSSYSGCGIFLAVVALVFAVINVGCPGKVEPPLAKEPLLG